MCSGAKLREKLCVLQVANQSINQTNDNNVKSLAVYVSLQDAPNKANLSKGGFIVADRPKYSLS